MLGKIEMLGKIAVIDSPSTTKLSWIALGLNLGLCSENPASKTLSCGRNHCGILP
jgi:hypothetical protein